MSIVAEPQNRAAEKDPALAACIGIDGADREHAWSREVPGQKLRSQGKLEHTPEAIGAWAMELAARFEGQVIAVALEQARGALLYALRAYGHFVLYSVQPTTSARYRAAMFPSGSKDDPKDSDLLLDLLVHHRDRLRRLQPDTPEMRKLQMLVEKRRPLVDERTAQTNRVRDLLKLYFPQVLSWFERMDMPLVAAFLDRWPSLESVQGAGDEQLRAFFPQHQCRSEERIQERIEAIRKAPALTRDTAVIDPSAAMVRVLLGRVAVLREGIVALDAEIEKVAVVQSDGEIFASFPGAGPALAPRLLVAFGSLRERFGSAQEVLSFSGIAPVISRRGQTQWTHFRWACPKFLRQTFPEYAARSMPHCEWAAAFYRRQRDKGKGHHAAVRSLAFKWIRVLFRCWQNRQPYQEELYLAGRKKQAAPMVAAPPVPTPTVPAPAHASCGKAVNSELKKISELLKILCAGA